MNLFRLGRPFGLVGIIALLTFALIWLILEILTPVLLP